MRERDTVDTSTEALDLRESEDAVLGGVAGGNAKVFCDRLHDRVRVAQHAWCSCAYLKVVFTNRIAVIHCIEGGDLYFALAPPIQFPNSIPLHIPLSPRMGAYHKLSSAESLKSWLLRSSLILSRTHAVSAPDRAKA